MKKVLFGNELIKKMESAINLICDTVSSTLGPTGNNVLINTSDTTPYITNDGVTIAKSIESEDITINTILEIVKEASLKTNEIVGDGTTTTLVLLQSIFNQGIKLILNGVNPIILKKELNDSVNKVVNIINKISVIPNNNNYKSVACISSNDKYIGNLVSEVFFKMKNKYSIKLEEGNIEKTYYDIKYGYNVEVDNISSMYFKSNREINLNNSYVGILKGYLDNLELISDIINEGIINNRNIVLLVEDFDTNINQELLVYYLSEHKNIFILKLPEYGLRREKIEEDISILSNCNIKNINYESIEFKDLGIVDNVIINTDEVILSCNKSSTKKLINNLKYELLNIQSEYDKEFIENRISKLENGQAIIYVGGTTKTEIREKIMRYEDALCALEGARDGVVLGEGVTLLKLSNLLKENNNGDKIIKNALQIPFYTIMKNLGKDSKEVYNKIEKNKFNKVYNYNTDKFEDISETTILDPTNVIITSIKNSVSIASMLLTTSYLVINENIKIEKDIL